jgi:hypothetical protein
MHVAQCGDDGDNVNPPICALVTHRRFDADARLLGMSVVKRRGSEFPRLDTCASTDVLA